MRYLFALCPGLLLLCVLGVPAVRAQAPGPGTPVPLAEGWVYHWGDPFPGPVPEWADSLRESVLWKPAPHLLSPPGERQEILWLRIRLPETLPDQAVVFAPVVLFSFEAYLDRELIHRYGPMGPGETVRFAGYRGHLIRLPPGAAGRLLALRLYSPEPRFIGLFMTPYAGAESDILRLALREGIDQTAIGLLFLVIGPLSLLVALRRRREAHARLPLYFGLFTLCTGLALVGDGFARRLFFPFPVLWYYLTSLGFYLFPVGLIGFFEQVDGPGRHSIVRRLWQLHLGFAAAALLLDLSGVVMMAQVRRIFFGLLTLSVLLMVVGGLVSFSRGDREAKAFGAGVLVAAVAGLHDTLFLGFGVNPTHPQLAAWGALAFVGFMCYILERRFFENLRRLRRSSAELERQSQKLRTAYERLEEHSATLEQKVEARTEELSRKNDELADKNTRLAETLHRLEAAQEQLVLREKLASLGQLTAGIAHEIKNPLNFVNNFSQLSVELADELQAALAAQHDRLGPEAANEIEAVLTDLRHSAEKIHYHGQRADSIVRSMMLHARGSAATPEPVDLHALLDEYAGLAYHGMRAEHPGVNVTLERDYDPAVGAVTLVPQEIGRVMLNLLGNAFYAVREQPGAGPPRVRLRTRRTSDAVEIRVEDNGPGIPAELRDRIFEPFFTTKPAGSGTGLGLSLSYEIVTRGHGGTLTVEGEEGAGAAFVVRLPEVARPAGEDGNDTSA